MAHDTETTDNTNADVKKEVASVCDISINQIFTALHFKAVEQAKKVNTDIKIENSAVDGEDESKAIFYGAGQHIIAAIPVKAGSLDEAGITREDALKPLQAYIQWFSGPDIKITPEQLNELNMSAGDKEKADDIKNSKKDDVAGEKYQKESIYVPSFSDYLLLEDGEDAATDASDKDDEAKKEESAETKDEDAETKDEDADSDTSEKAKGWYITFNLDIKGQKSHPLADALKKFAKNLIEGFGVSTFDWRSGATGELKTIGDMLDSLDQVFGKIDPDDLLKNYNDNFKKKFPQGEATSQIWDTKTINQHLKKNLDSKSKNKLKSADLALCTRVDKRDKSYKLYNSQLIADTVTASIQGLYKKFKNKISKDDVIMVNNYSDDKKDKEQKEYTGDKAEGAVQDNLKIANNGQLLTEAKEEISLAEVKGELDALVKADLKNYKPSSYVGSTKNIIELLKKYGVDEQKWFTALENSKSKYCFMIKTNEPVSKKEDVSASNKPNYGLLNILFEKTLTTEDTTVVDKVKNIFRKLIDKFKTYVKDKDLTFDMIDSLTGHISDNDVKESVAIQKSLSFMKMIYEDIDNNSILELLEKTNSQKDRDHITNDQAKQLINAIHTKGLKAIQKNIKDVEMKWGEIKAGQKDFSLKKYDPIYSDVKNLLMSTADDAEDKITSYINSAIHDKSETAKKKKIILTRLIPAIKDIAADEDENDESIEITFIDKDPNEQKEDKEIAKIKKEDGKKIELPDPPKHAGWEFKGWDPNPEDMKESGQTFTTYEEQTNAEDDDVEITYMDIDDPSKQDDESAYKELKKIIKNPDGSIESPTPSAKDGYEFEKWQPDPDDMSKSGQTFAIYKAKDAEAEPESNTQVVYYVVPDENGLLNDATYSIVFVTADAEKFDDKTQWKQIEEPQQIANANDIKYPAKTPTAPDGYVFTSWVPSEVDFKKHGIQTYFLDDKYLMQDDKGNTQIAIRAKFEKDAAHQTFEINIVNPDPEDPDNTKTWKDVATITVVADNGKKYYKAEDLKELAKKTQSKELADKYNDIAAKNQEAFKQVDNLKGYDNKPYSLLKNEPWNPPLADAVEAGPKNGEDKVIVKAQYENALKTKHTELDFYIVPMKGLSYNTRKRQKEEGNK